VRNLTHPPCILKSGRNGLVMKASGRPKQRHKVNENLTLGSTSQPSMAWPI